MRGADPHSERQLMEQIDYNLLFRWFIGLGVDDPVWDHSTFSKNRDRLLGPTTGTPAPTAGEQKGQHPPTAIMGEQVESRTLSPGDVQRQTGINTGATSALALARKLDALDRPECKDAVDLAQELSRQ